jgi:tetratricopeptide (TPR) repeat protein
MGKPPGLVRSKKGNAKAKIKSGSAQSDKGSSSGHAAKKARQETLMRSEKKGVKHSKAQAAEKSRKEGVAARRNVAGIGPAADTPPRLLSDSKTTAAALTQLEKAIKLIFQKEFKRACAELKSLIESHPGETEIIARARSYIHICEREDGTQKRPVPTNDQLYSLGVMEHNRGNFDAALSYFRRSLESHPNADYILYSMAASMSMSGSVAEALENLRKAIELNEDNRVYAKNDSDFSSLHPHREFTDLVGISPSANAEP